MPQLLEVSHVSRRGVSLRITVPKKAAEFLGLGEGNIVGFYSVNDEIYIRKMK